TVLFESGMGASCLSWTLVQPAVAEFSRAVSYDRAGHGWSGPAHEPRTAQQIAKELRALLSVAGVPGPYVLVGHSVRTSNAEATRSVRLVSTRIGLSDDAPCVLILAESCKFRVAQMVALGPFQELDLSNKLRANPNAVLHVFRRQTLAPARAPLLRKVGEG